MIFVKARLLTLAKVSCLMVFVKKLASCPQALFNFTRSRLEKGNIHYFVSSLSICEHASEVRLGVWKFKIVSLLTRLCLGVLLCHTLWITEENECLRLAKSSCPEEDKFGSCYKVYHVIVIARMNQCS